MTLTPLDFVFTLGFLGLTIAISAALGLGLTRQWLTAGGRTLLQLAGLGYLLAIATDGSNNAQNIPWAIAVTLAVIALGVFNIYKQVQGLPRWVYGAIALGLGGALLVSTSIIVLIILRPAQWATPALWFAITAAIATPASHGTAQTALALHQTLVRRQRQAYHQSSPPSNPSDTPPSPSPEPPAVEDEWVDGWDWSEDGKNTGVSPVTASPATASPAAAPQKKRSNPKHDAIRQGVTPILNGLMTAGISTIPLFLSGQLLGGIPPLTAVSLQITTLFAAALTTLLGAIAAAESIAIAIQSMAHPPSNR